MSSSACSAAAARADYVKIYGKDLGSEPLNIAEVKGYGRVLPPPSPPNGGHCDPNKNASRCAYTSDGSAAPANATAVPVSDCQVSSP